MISTTLTVWKMLDITSQKGYASHSPPRTTCLGLRQPPDIRFEDRQESLGEITTVTPNSDTFSKAFPAFLVLQRVLMNVCLSLTLTTLTTMTVAFIESSVAASTVSRRVLHRVHLPPFTDLSSIALAHLAVALAFARAQ